MEDVIVLSDSDESGEELHEKNNKRSIDSPVANSELNLSDSESLDNVLDSNYRLKSKHKKLELNDEDEEMYNLIYNATEKKSISSRIAKKTTNIKSKLNNKDEEGNASSDSELFDRYIRKNSDPNATNNVDLSDFEFPDISLEVKKNVERKDSKEKELSDSSLPETDIYIEAISEDKNRRRKESNDYNLQGTSDDIVNVDEKELTDFDVAEVDTEMRMHLNEKNNENKRSNNESESDSDYESQNPSVNYYKQYKEQYKEKQKATNGLNIDSSDESDDWLAEDKNKKSKGKATNSKKITNEEKKRMQEEKKLKKEAEKRKKEEEKQRKKEEREQEKIKKKKELAKQKALKQMNSKNRLNFNPDYSMKLMKVIFDEDLENLDFFTDFIKSTEESEITYDVQSQIVPKTIIWTRRVEENYINDKHEVCSNSKVVNENHVMVIWDCKETVQHVVDGTLSATISNIKSLLPSKKIYLVIYRIDDYFKFLKHKTDQNIRDEVLGDAGKQKKSKTKFDKSYADMPIISKKNLEKYLVEIQLLYNVSSRLIENEIEMVLLINQYTKSLALLPSKMEKRKESKLDWYVNCDNRDTVKVDKHGNGLRRLWQQQICQFNLTSLEMSEAITSVYKSPLELMDAYEKCTPAEGELLLKDIPIRRAAGQLTAIRKIGPELSKKIYLMFTTENGEIYFNDTNE